MKKLILFMFLPLMSFGQVITYEDLKSITDEKQFQRVFIENNYQRFEDAEFDEETLAYAYDLQGKGKDAKSKSFAMYHLDNKVFGVAYTGKWVYNEIFDVAKEDLEFVKVDEDDLQFIKMAIFISALK
jgi:hypothetical protein